MDSDERTDNRKSHVITQAQAFPPYQAYTTSESSHLDLRHHEHNQPLTTRQIPFSENHALIDNHHGKAQCPYVSERAPAQICLAHESTSGHQQVIVLIETADDLNLGGLHCNGVLTFLSFTTQFDQ